MATMKDVAKAAGVSLGSVSHYLSGRVAVSPVKASQIQRAIDELGYRVDQGARSLRRKQTQTIGLILPDISNPFYGELARVIEHRLWDKGFQVFFCDSACDTVREQAQFLNLLDRRADGIFVIYSSERSVLPQLASETETPVIFLDRPVRGRPSVASDNFLGGRMAAEHLLSLGHAHIGALVGNAEIANIQDRMAGFTAALTQEGITLNPEYVLYGAQDLALGDRIVELMHLKSPPTAIFATNDIVAIGAWRKLLEQGFNIPQDVSLLGFDNVELGRLLLPPLTTIAQNISRLGAYATELLLSHFGNPMAVGRGAVVAPQLLVRGSTTHKGGEGKRM